MSDSPRPPYVVFEKRPVEDRAASEEAGHFVAKDVTFAIITPAGTKDRIEKIAEEWIGGLDEGVRQERIPVEWPKLFRDALKHWEETQEDPEFGTPITSWPAVTPAQVKNIHGANIRSIEDMAEASVEAINRIGMGGQALKQKAQAWLDSSKDTGKTAAELEKLRQANADKDDIIKELQASLTALRKEVDALQKVKA